MEKTINTDHPATIEELITAMEDPTGRYKHLQFILYRNESRLGLSFGQKYLVVNQIGFGVYELNSVDYNNGILQMLLTNPDTGNTAEINLDVNDDHPEYFFICWNDIKSMVYDEITNNYFDNELLEIDTE